MNMCRGDRKEQLRCEIINKVKDNDLPLSVRSTSVKIFNIASGEMLEKIDDLESFICLIILVAAKCEEIHGGIDKIFRKIPLERKNNILRYEDHLFRILDFNFSFSSPYTKIFAIIVLLQEREILEIVDTENEDNTCDSYKELYFMRKNRYKSFDVNKVYSNAVDNMDLILTMNTSKYLEIEMVYASIALPPSAFESLDFKYSVDNVKEIRENLERLNSANN